MYDILSGRSMTCVRCLSTDRRGFMSDTGAGQCCVPSISRPVHGGYDVRLIIRQCILCGSQWVPEAEARDRGTLATWRRIKAILDVGSVPVGDGDRPVLAWVASLAEKMEHECTDYECQVLALVRRGYVGDEHFALAAGIVHAWRKAQRETPAPVAEPTGQWLGVLKERTDVPGCQCHSVTPLGKNEEHPEWGERFLIKFTSAAGHDLAWFTGTGGKFDPKVGETYDLRLTPVKHDVYQGRKSTVVSRCSSL